MIVSKADRVKDYRATYTPCTVLFRNIFHIMHNINARVAESAESEGGRGSGRDVSGK